MNFNELTEKYMVNSSCSEHQSAFVWNAAIDECIKQLQYKCSTAKEPVKILETLRVQLPVVIFKDLHDNKEESE